MRVIDHRLVGAAQVPSPNCNARPDPADVSLIVVHGISVPPAEFGSGHVARMFCNRLDPQDHPVFAELCELRVSAHLLIERDGAVTQFVDFDRRAWHAGVSTWAGRDNCNDFSIGIELEGTDDLAYEPVQYRRLAAACRALLAEYPDTTPERIVGHSDIAPGRKTDPGPAFDWPLLHELLAGPGPITASGGAA